MSFKEIAAKISKDRTTISKEVRANRVFKQANPFKDGLPNLCVHRKKCNKTHVCEPQYWSRRCHSAGCRQCGYCNESCEKFEKEECRTLSSAPYCCNGCKRKAACRLEKYYYRAVTAQRKYEQRLRSSRMGINISEAELMELDNFITPLIKKGQPVSHIYNSAPDRMPCSRSTLYRYISSGAMSVKNLDMRRLVRYKQRRKKRTPRNIIARHGRAYQDFLQFQVDNPDLHIWEMDIVEGIKGGKVFLTLFSRETKLMLIFLLEKNTQEEVRATLDGFEEQIGADLFFKVFQIILTDNDGSFLNATETEMSFIGGKKRTFLFYCEPYSFFQKGGLEKNHEYIRWVLPKGSSFDDLTYIGVDLLASHINSVARDSLDGLTPYAAMNNLHPSLISKVNLTLFPPNEVNLTKYLLK
jgi:IS30 family transposase